MKINAIVPIAAILIVVLLLIVFTFSYKNTGGNIDMKGVATMNNPVISPSGKYQIKIIEETINGVKNNKFTLLKISNGDQEPTVIFNSNDVFRTRDTLFFVWDDNDRVWMYSGDVGTLFWERITDENWQKHAYIDNKNVPVPALLKKLKPGYYESICK